MPKYKARPTVVVEAVQYNGNNAAEVAKIVGDTFWSCPVGDYIYRTSTGDIYHCNPGIFLDEYEIEE